MKSNLFIKQVIGALIFFSTIFFCAGRIVYFQGLTYVVLGIFMIVLNYSILKLDKDLMKERSKPGDGAKSWDKKILGVSFNATIAMYAVAGFDSGRFHWSPEFHWSLYVIGFILTATGQLLFLIAQKQNRFFSSIVRIQSDRGHTVCNSGLYRIVRHPAYFGSFIQTVGFPLLFGSLWSIIPISLSIFLLILRTQLEDLTLQAELSGYSEFIKSTKYKLIPFIW